MHLLDVGANGFRYQPHGSMVVDFVSSCRQSMTIFFGTGLFNWNPLGTKPVRLQESRKTMWLVKRVFEVGNTNTLGNLWQSSQLGQGNAEEGRDGNHDDKVEGRTKLSRWQKVGRMQK